MTKVTSKSNKGSKREKVSIRDSVVITLGKHSVRLTRLAERLEANAPEASEAVHAALAQLDNAATAMRALPETFRFSAGKRGGAKRFAVEVGATVALREKRRGKYEGLLADDEMGGLKVVKLIGSRLKVETKSGTALILGKNEVQREEASA